jgi:hypothetical protein
VNASRVFARCIRTQRAQYLHRRHRLLTLALNFNFQQELEKWLTEAEQCRNGGNRLTLRLEQLMPADLFIPREVHTRADGKLAHDDQEASASCRRSTLVQKSPHGLDKLGRSKWLSHKDALRHTHRRPVCRGPASHINDGNFRDHLSCMSS